MHLARIMVAFPLWILSDTLRWLGRRLGRWAEQVDPSLPATIGVAR